MSSTNVGGSPAVGRGATTARSDTIALINFALYKDDPNNLSWIDRRKLARQLGCTVLPNTTWEALQPSLLRRLSAIRQSQSPSASGERQRQAEIDRINRRKRKREEEAALDRALLERLLRTEKEKEVSGNGSSTSNRRLMLTTTTTDVSDGMTDNSGSSSGSHAIADERRTDRNEIEFVGSIQGTLPNSIANHIKLGGGETGRKTKVGREHFTKMQAELQQSRKELIPLQIAEALFDFDLGKLIKYAVILIPAVQRRYITKRKTTKKSDRSKRKDFLANIMAVTLDEDTEAEDIVNQNTVEGVVVYATVFEKYVIPLVELAWDPLLASSLSGKMKEFIEELETDNITDMHGWREILDATWTQLSLKLASMSANFTLVRQMLNTVDLKQRFNERKQNHILQLVSERIGGNGRNNSNTNNSYNNQMIDRKGVGNGRNNSSTNNSNSNQKIDRKGVEKAFKKLKSLFGENTKFDGEFYRKWGASKHGDGVCLMGCLGGCNRGESCKFSHDYKSAFPKGDGCITGKCDCKK